MTGPELLQSLMDAAGDNAYAVASSLRKPALQSYIWKFLNGRAKEPRRASLQPLADRYRVPVDAFYDEALAQRIAVERGFAAGSVQPAAPLEVVVPSDEFAKALKVLARAFSSVDRSKQVALAHTFSLLVTHPEEVENVLDTVLKLLPDDKRTREGRDDQSRGSIQFSISSEGFGNSGQRDQVSENGKRGGAK